MKVSPWTILAAGCALAAGCSNEPGLASASQALCDSTEVLELAQLQKSATWTTCSTSGANCGGTGGVGTPVTSTFTVGTFAGRNHAAELAIGGDVPYGTAYWYTKNAPPPFQAETLHLRTDFFIPTGSVYQAIEWDPQQVRGTRIFNFGLQANRVLGQWRFFDYARKEWRDTGIALPELAQGTWHVVKVDYHTDGNDIVLDGITLDGASAAPTQYARMPSVIDATYTEDGLSMGLQLDQAYAGDAYAVYYDHVNLTAECHSDWCQAPPTEPACAPPAITSPSQGAVLGPYATIAAAGPSCMAAIDCYVDGDAEPAVTGSGASVEQTLEIAPGDHVVRCLGRDGDGTLYTTPGAVTFSTGCAAPTIASPTAGAMVGDTVELVVTAPGCVTATVCYLDGHQIANGPGELATSIAVTPGPHTLSCNGWDWLGNVYVSGGSPFTSVAPVGAPLIVSPGTGDTVTGIVALAVEAPAGIVAIRCYVDNVDVASALGHALAQQVSVSAGTHFVSCNGWDQNGAVYVSSPTTFSSTTSGPPVIVSPTVGQHVVGTAHLVVQAPATINAIACYVDGNPTPVAVEQGHVVDASVAVAVGPHEVQCNGWDASGAVFVGPRVAFVGD